MANSIVMEKLKQRRWLTTLLYLVVLTGISAGLAYLLRYLMTYFGISVSGFAATAYLVIFWNHLGIER